ncbi:MAG TPA: antibiotic biosynthesis monooxygenase family protein [Longimicrobium sp.]
MFVFISHLTVPPEDHGELERHFRERSRLVDGFPGFLYLQLMRPQAGPATHTFLTAWESREAFRAYMGSEEHSISHSREPGAIMERTSVRHEAFEVLMDSRAVPEWRAAPVAAGESIAPAEPYTVGAGAHDHG